jgi:hypothetical protein
MMEEWNGGKTYGIMEYWNDGMMGRDGRSEEYK